MKRESQAIKHWDQCVKTAKESYGLSGSDYMILSGKILTRAMLIYCAMGY